MEMKFTKNTLECLRPTAGPVHTQEQTQEIRLPDGYPDVGTVLGCWGEVLIRGKEWRSASMSANGGVMVWVMYMPEDGTQPRVLDAWIPIQSRWELPDGSDEGVIILKPVITHVDGRGVSARKVLVRVCVDVYAHAMCKDTLEIAQPPKMPDDVQLLIQNYPVDLSMESGEKQIQLEEILTLDDNLPPIHKIVCYHGVPSVSEQKVLGNRLVFRGQMVLHLLYMTEDGTIGQWKKEIPFSQYTELDGEYGNTATAWVLPIMTALELDRGEDQNWNLRAGIAAQYTIFDKKMIEIVEDAYSHNRQITLKMEEIQVPAVLDTTNMELPLESSLKGDISKIYNTSIYGTYPVLRHGDADNLEMDGQFACICNNAEGTMQEERANFSAKVPFPGATENQVQIWMGDMDEPDVSAGADGFILRGQVPVAVHVYSGQSVPMITELEMGELQEPDPKRPSIILRRADNEGLWEIAKKCGSSVAAIQEANQLTGEPEMGQILLIPVG